MITLDAPAETPPPVFEEALRWFRGRVPMTDAAFAALSVEAQRRAFTLAGAAALTVVSDVWRSLDATLAAGRTLRDFKRDVAPALLGEWQGSVAAPAWRMETIFRNATQRAYVHGRVEQLRDPEVAPLRPFWMFDAVGDARTSAICAALDGTVLAASDPWWASHTPPCHHACRSTLRGLRASDPRAQAAAGQTPPTVDAQKGFGELPGADDWRPREGDYPAPAWAAYQSNPQAYRAAAPRAPTREMPVFTPPPAPKPKTPTAPMPVFTPPKAAPPTPAAKPAPAAKTPKAKAAPKPKAPKPGRERVEFEAPKPKRVAALPTARADRFKDLPINRLVDKKLLGDLSPKDYPQNLVESGPFYAHVAKGIGAAPLTDAQRMALNRYTGPAYGPVNLYLRAGEDAVRKKYGPRGMADVQDIARDTAAALRELPAPPANMVLFRGAMFGNIADLDALASAETVSSPSFASTSRDPRVAVGFAGGMFGSDPSVVYRIRKHTSGAVLAPPTSLESEYEVLFPPGARFRVVGRQRVSESQLLLDIEEITE